MTESQPMRLCEKCGQMVQEGEYLRHMILHMEESTRKCVAAIDKIQEALGGTPGNRG